MIEATIFTQIAEVLFGSLAIVLLVLVAGFLLGVWVWSLAALARGGLWLGFVLAAGLPLLAPFLAAIFTWKEESASKEQLLRYFIEGIIAVPLLVVLGWPFGVAVPVLVALVEAGIIGGKEWQLLQEVFKGQKKSPKEAKGKDGELEKD